MSDGQERRANNDKIMKHMGMVEQYMKDDKTWKEAIVSVDADNRLTTVESSQKWIIRIGSIFTLTGFSILGRWIYKHL